MGNTQTAVYLVGLLLVVGAAWVFLTQTELGQQIPGGVALALILLLVGIGVMASARSIDDRRVERRVVHETAPGAPVVGRDRVYGSRETVVEERRYD